MPKECSIKGLEAIMIYLGQSKTILISSIIFGMETCSKGPRLLKSRWNASESLDAGEQLASLALGCSMPWSGFATKTIRLAMRHDQFCTIAKFLDVEPLQADFNQHVPENLENCGKFQNHQLNTHTGPLAG